MDIPWIPVSGCCLVDAEVLERDENGNPISWICPECGNVEYGNENHNYMED